MCCARFCREKNGNLTDKMCLWSILSDQYLQKSVKKPSNPSETFDYIVKTAKMIDGMFSIRKPASLLLCCGDGQIRAAPTSSSACARKWALPLFPAIRFVCLVGLGMAGSK